MFNPFSHFDPRYLPEFKKKGIRAFVMQLYERGRNMLEDNPRPAYLLSHFDRLDIANQHFDALKHDSTRQLFMLGDSAQYNELQNRLRSTDAVYYTRLIIKDANQKAQKILDKKIHAYIDYKTSWRPSRYDEVSFELDVIFGQIYVLLKFKGRDVKIKLEELENQKDYVL